MLADALGSAGVIVSTLMIQYWGWYLADPIASLIISILILLSVLSLVQSTANVLLSRVPEGMEVTLRDAVIQVTESRSGASLSRMRFVNKCGCCVVFVSAGKLMLPPAL